MKIGKIEKQLISIASSNNEHLVFVQKSNNPNNKNKNIIDEELAKSDMDDVMSD